MRADNAHTIPVVLQPQLNRHVPGADCGRSLRSAHAHSCVAVRSVVFLGAGQDLALVYVHLVYTGVHHNMLRACTAARLVLLLQDGWGWFCWAHRGCVAKAAGLSSVCTTSCGTFGVDRGLFLDPLQSPLALWWACLLHCMLARAGLRSWLFPGGLHRLKWLDCQAPTRAHGLLRLGGDVCLSLSRAVVSICVVMPMPLATMFSPKCWLGGDCRCGRVSTPAAAGMSSVCRGSVKSHALSWCCG